jgi:polyferredoxin
MSERLPMEENGTELRAAVASVDVAVSEGFDLLRLRVIRAVVRWPGFPRVLQGATLLAFIALATAGWHVFTPAGLNAKLFAKAHLVTLLIWGMWWPAMVWVAVLFGRVWCAVCPLELVSSVYERAARGLGFRQWPLPRWIVSGVVIVAMYAGIQMLVAGLHIHRIPAYTSVFLVSLLVLAAAAGFLFRDRAFCRGFCPVGVLLNVYGRGAMLAVRPGRVESAGCAAIDARTCPSLLNPSKLSSSAHCLVCAKCLKSAAPGQMQLLLRRPFAAANTREPAASWPLTIFVMLVSGFVIGELFSEWPVGEEYFLAAPLSLAAKLGIGAHAGWIEGAWSLAVVPLVLWSLLAGVATALGTRESFGALWRQMALPMAVVISAGHMSKGLAKFVSWAAFLPEALRRTDAAETARAIASKSMATPTPLLPMSVVAVVAFALIVAAFVYSVREYKIASRPGTPRIGAIAFLAPVALSLLGIVTCWALR